ncbi:ABC transporter ATP-binding protein [Bauldia litoralis]|uniref:ATP-binding cassette, subfamily B n=1 Tax=Bauldia litoralis TaxID=665467 RepID=A0A1G6CVZ5_9HYPH|nr:ABC transporter ATP-binding protein [Bauldia litoralis]SDB36855.1 ATP-binding cassette, subfamily B [Bauldia litoralis]
MELAFSVVLSVLQSLLLIPIAWLIKVIFDRILAHAGLIELLIPCGVILFLAAASSGMLLLSRHHSLRVTKLVIGDLRQEMMAKAYQLAGLFSSAADRSALHNTIVHDTERLDIGSNAIAGVVLPGLITSLIFGIVLMIVAPTLLVSTLLMVPFTFLANRFLGRALRHRVDRFRTAFRNFDGNVIAALRRTELTRLRGAEAFELQSQAVHVDALSSAGSRVAWTATAYTALQAFVITIVSVITLIVGGNAVAMGWMTVGALAAYFFVLAQLGSSIKAMWIALPSVLAGINALDAIARTLAAERQTPAGGTLEHVVEGGITCRDIHFSHGPDPLLAGLDLSVPPGATVAIIGPNGSGKTTLICLLLGLYEPDSGSLLIDGKPLADMALDHYRRQVGVVLQDPLIFSGTISANIAYGFPSATAAEVAAAAALSGADAFIRTLPDGYDTDIGKAGVSLSGGQHQMLAIARALLGNPKILILDEPTNHLDERTVRTLLANIEALSSQPTVIVITHDRELATRMSTVHALEGGRLPLVGGQGRPLSA